MIVLIVSVFVYKCRRKCCMGKVADVKHVLF